jgi:hypothetical protein
LDETNYNNFSLGYGEHEALEQDTLDTRNNLNITNRPELLLLDYLFITQEEDTPHPLSQLLVENIEDQTWDTRASVELYKKIIRQH